MPYTEYTDGLLKYVINTVIHKAYKYGCAHMRLYVWVAPLADNECLEPLESFMHEQPTLLQTSFWVSK